jgi:hypothetical protein
MCGANARCTRGFCVCDLGMKGNGTAEGWRGNDGLGEVTVYNDISVDCDTACDDLSCKEVEQLDVGVCWKSADGGSGSPSTVVGSQASKLVSSGNGMATFVDTGAGGMAN